LQNGLEQTTRAEDRAVYTQLLADAAGLGALLIEGTNGEQIERWMEAESQRYGRGYLSGSPGEAAESAFVSLRHRFASRFAGPS